MVTVGEWPVVNIAHGGLVEVGDDSGDLESIAFLATDTGLWTLERDLREQYTDLTLTEGKV